MIWRTFPRYFYDRLCQNVPGNNALLFGRDRKKLNHPNGHLPGIYHWASYPCTSFVNNRCFICNRMVIITQEKLFKGVEWILFICLCFVSAFFMKEVLENFFSNKSSFIQYREPITEHPTITICMSLTEEFKYEFGIINFTFGTDFNITILLEEAGEGRPHFPCFFFYFPTGRTR